MIPLKGIKSAKVINYLCKHKEVVKIISENLLQSVHNIKLPYDLRILGIHKLVFLWGFLCCTGKK